MSNKKQEFFGWVSLFLFQLRAGMNGMAEKILLFIFICGSIEEGNEREKKKVLKITCCHLYT